MKKFILNLARNTIETFVRTGNIIPIPEKYPEKLNEKKGVFVTIYRKHLSGKELRGCIGYPYPQKPLIEAVIDSAVSACKDPRLPPLQPEELKDISIEISVLTKPEEIKVENPKEYLKKIRIGRDGLIIKQGHAQGLLLPQVPVEQKWNVEQYLENLCHKAGLLPDAWMDKYTKIYRFETEILEQ